MPGGHDAIVEHSADAPYTGAVGETCREIYDVPGSEGGTRVVSLVRTLNVRTDPQLKVRALSGLLHDVPGGQTLAAAFVYHDPQEQRFVLVIPAVLAHTAFEESAKLMLALAQDRTAPVPPYVRGFPTVIGVDALRQNLEEVTDVDGDELREASELDVERAHKLSQRERGLAEQEAGLIRLAEELTARQGKLDHSRAEFAVEVSAHEEREREWVEKLEQTRHEAEVVPPETADTAWQEVGALREEATVVAAVPDALMRNALRRNSDVSEVSSAEVRQQPPPLHRNDYSPSAAPPPLHRNDTHRTAKPPPLHPSSTARTGPPPLHPARTIEPPPLPVPDIAQPPPLHSTVGDDEVLPSETPPRMPQGDGDVSSVGSVRSPEVAPPASFFAHARGPMAMISDPDALWLYADVDHTECDAYLRASDMLLQCVVHNGYPIVLLTLTGGDERAQHVLRLPLDGRSPEDLLVLEGLAESYRARVAFYVDGEYVDTITVASLREGVARAVLDHIEDSTTMPGISAADAIAHVLATPPPVDNPDLPFGPARRQASSTVAVRAAVEQLASWMRPAKLREASLIYSVPTHVVEGAARRVLRSAKLYGVALPEELVEAAVEYGVVGDRAELVAAQLEAFKKHVDAGDNLGEDGTRDNWQKLFAQADAAGVEVEEGDAAPPASASAPAPEQVDSSDASDGDSEPPPASSANLKAQLHDPQTRMSAIAELAMRGHPSLVEPIFEVLESLTPGEVAAGVAALVSFGEHAAEPLQRGLDSPNLHLRHACALALGRLKLQRSIAPLLQILDTEPTNIWVEIARAMGDFGGFGVRSVVRAIPTASKPERLMLVLAHLANHGAAKDVETLENDTDDEVAMSARKAMARRSRLEWEDLAIREQRTLTDSSAAARFSQGFYAELSKVDN